MITFIIFAFLIGYVCIAMEHPLGVNKAATALLLAVVLWTTYIFCAPMLSEFAGLNHEQILDRIIGEDGKIVLNLGDISQILFFLLGAMTIVELVDVHGGFSIITDKITTKKKRKLLWILAFVTFFLSAILDNMTTAIVMTMLLRKLVSDSKDRWIFAGIVIIAANSGGAFSPIGDVTTIMLWIRGFVTSSSLILELILPSLVSLVIPVALASRWLKGELSTEAVAETKGHENSPIGIITKREKNIIFALGVGSLIFVPIFKSITHLPPFIGILLGLSVLWIYTELLYKRKKDVAESRKARISAILNRIDTSTILFFMGILMAVSVLKETGILASFAEILNEKVGNFYVINIIIGLLSSVVDNVPLVAGAMGMYSIDPSSIYFMQDGIFWIFLAYCAGVGGSILIIGSAAGVVVMGLEKINFIWYMKKISLITLLGYLAGALIYIVQMQFILPLLQ
ncbi:MAG: sodium:proton antiporter NhaD [Prevotellaceae bacterium]|jgi:Na+/H+ antiporter NhaD/arsenite permease-like protein|nr:sodium:proton antiporter NhaD [Prevotellaceae bacterium]